MIILKHMKTLEKLLLVKECLLDYPCFKESYKMIAIDLCKQQALNIDSRPVQQINFIANLDRAEKTTMFFIIDEAKETFLDFSERTVKVY